MLLGVYHAYFPRAILLVKSSYIEQHIGLDCGIEQSGNDDEFTPS